METRRFDCYGWRHPRDSREGRYQCRELIERNCGTPGLRWRGLSPALAEASRGDWNRKMVVGREAPESKKVSASELEAC